jgi:hypothetical protein
MRTSAPLSNSVLTPSLAFAPTDCAFRDCNDQLTFNMGGRSEWPVVAEENGGETRGGAADSGRGAVVS